MSLYYVRSVKILPIFKIFPIIFLILGFIIGLFVLLPSTSTVNLTGFGVRFMSWCIFGALYTTIMTICTVIIAWFYNLISSKLGESIIISIEHKE